MLTSEPLSLLSRVADALYWIGRFLERAEHTARLLDVHNSLALDGAADERDWTQLIELTRDEASYPANWPVDPDWVARFVVQYPGNPNAIVACLTVARENARGVRGAISSELWEQINALYWAVRNDVDADSWSVDPHAFIQTVKQGAHLFHGLADETMLHDEGGAFLRLGKYLERAVNTVRLVDAKYHGLDIDAEPDLLRCAALLKMCSAFEAYRRFYAAPVDPRRAIEFLLLNPSFPRSALWASRAATQEGRRIAEQNHAGRQPERLLGGLSAQLEFASVDELLDQGLDRFLHSFRSRAWDAEKTLARSFFRRDERPRMPGRPSFAPQQQQQQQSGRPWS
jgi:uncharacterized alpha-E superfamily protein